MEDKSFQIEVKFSEVSLLLKKVIVSPHADIITKIIMGNLNTTSLGVQQLFKALNGLDNNSKWKVGMEILIKENIVYATMDKVKMKEEGMIFQGYIKALINKVDVYNYYPISVEFEIINSTGEKTKYEQTILENNIKESEKWPE